ncbi:intraflagellar transport protein 81 homolog isoform X1 [Athalia rosae]|uniref:intraflagellar transport protein 81 homolog isoform X1 n=2 Tax=Athalia rosae TaxID=37344 RepID=UPI0020337C99|nr:intraflagellar transport protein 81 homolog isoform X1 [Athalia rosae]
MSEDIKFITTELNKVLNRKYNLISFDALTSQDLLQVLSDVLADIQQDGPPHDIRIETPEQSSIRIFSALRILKYQPQGDPTLFRQELVKGEPQAIHAVLKWLLSNMDIVRQRAYLARFLVKVEIPAEYMGDPELTGLYEQYGRLVEEFKVIHKERESGKKGGEAAAELKTDLEAMEKEREVILGRVEKMRVRAESAPQLLQVARKLRVERDRERELALQKQQQQESIATLQSSLQRAERELYNLKEAGVTLTPAKLIQRLSEEVTVQMVMTRERLPAEIADKKAHVNALKLVTRSPQLGPDDILAFRNRLDVAAREVQTLAEKKATAGTDKMAPFRQQAAAVAGMKRTILDKLKRSEETLEELSVRVTEKREEARQLAEEPTPRGEDLKRYVAHLRARSALYKQRRAELAGLRAESGVLNRSLRILETKLSHVKSDVNSATTKAAKTLPDGFTAENATTANAELAGHISELRAQLVILLNGTSYSRQQSAVNVDNLCFLKICSAELRPLRQRAQELDEQHSRAEKSHRSIEANFENSIATLSTELNFLRSRIEAEVAEAKQLRTDVSKLKIDQEKIQHEMRRYASPGGGPTLRDELNEAIQTEEKKLSIAKNEEETIKQQTITSEAQMRLWNDLISIYECKLQCAEDNKRRDGVVVRGQGAETLILQ